jgi:hypothetical protein
VSAADKSRQGKEEKIPMSQEGIERIKQEAEVRRRSSLMRTRGSRRGSTPKTA